MSKKIPEKITPEEKKRLAELYKKLMKPEVESKPNEEKSEKSES
ncbi:MAG: hypothetical protein ABSC53_15345 [Bacteroidota bacterium]